MSLAYEPCRCGCKPLVLTGCGCSECLPGPPPPPRPENRLRTLLLRRHLTPPEEAELESLLWEFTHRSTREGSR